jgi:hypothetical protein
VTTTEQAPTAGPAAPPGWRRLADAAFTHREASITVVTVALAIYFYFNAIDFVSSDNAETLSTFIAATAIIAAGETSRSARSTPSPRSSSTRPTTRGSRSCSLSSWR